MHSFKAKAPLTAAVALFTSVVRAPVAFAQTGATPPATALAAVADAPSILSVPLPPYARLRFDMDARGDDMLGVVKSFLNGFDATSLKELLPPSAPAKTAGPDGTAAPASAVDLDKAAAMQLLSDADLSTILQNISQVRFVVFEPRRTNASRDWSVRRSGKEQKEIIAYYEQKYIEREGGRRMLRADFDEVQMLAVAFPGNGFAAVVQTSDVGIIFRADGYPDFSGLGPMVMASMIRFAPLMSPMGSGMSPNTTYQISPSMQ